MANWFYYDNFGFRQGPITDNDLKSLVAQGIITPQTKMETEDGKSDFASQIKGLFLQQPYINGTTDFALPPDHQQQSQYSQQQYPPQYGQPAYTPTSRLKPPADYLIWSIITAVCMCVPLGIVAIVMSVQAKSAFQLGDYA
ncbi:MAG: CD225/dispanin family protein, partial [Planctomycetaceae bacterium]|nr:CD225/dispanin family protein [Planctomycetaceae bacterium]